MRFRVLGESETEKYSSMETLPSHPEEWTRGCSSFLGLLGCSGCPGPQWGVPSLSPVLYEALPIRLRGSLPSVLWVSLQPSLSSLPTLWQFLWELPVLGCCSGHLTYKASFNDLFFFLCFRKVNFNCGLPYHIDNTSNLNGATRVPISFYFLIWVVISWVCSLHDSSLS